MDLYPNRGTVLNILYHQGVAKVLYPNLSDFATTLLYCRKNFQIRFDPTTYEVRVQSSSDQHYVLKRPI